MKMTVRHYYDFGPERSVVGDDLVNPDSWDGLRTTTRGVFSIPDSREEFERIARDRADIAARASAIDEWLESGHAHVVASYGVGGAALEWWLHTIRSERKLILTDYGEATIERLARILPAIDVRHHDLRKDAPIPADIHLFHRVDTELTNEEWHATFARFRSERVLFVAAEVLDLARLAFEMYSRMRMLGRASRAGFLRNRAAFEALWASTHASEPIEMHDLHAWTLSPKSNQRASASAAAAAVRSTSSSESSG
jgi:hypothetical protein